MTILERERREKLGCIFFSKVHDAARLEGDEPESAALFAFIDFDINVWIRLAPVLREESPQTVLIALRS